jgi:hypothetical protein
MSGNVMLIAGQSGAKSTFAGGLLQYADKEDGYSIVDSVDGNELDYQQSIIDMMFTQGEYPDQTTEGYIATYELDGKAFSRPGLTISIVDFPGEKQDITLNPAGDLPLMERVRNGQVDDRESIFQDYEQNIKSDFKRGKTPDQRSGWETTFLYHYYKADKAIFLLNLYKVTEMDDKELVFSKQTIQHANSEFSDVAVVPIAVDWFGYDPDTYDPSFVRRITDALLQPARRDMELMKHLKQHIHRSDHPKANQILNYVESEGEIDFFSVSVPDKGSPQKAEGRLLGDGQGGFTTKGFGEVIRWLET